MSKPSNPFEVVIKNRFYPKGLNELSIYDYWLSKKTEIVSQLQGKRVMFYLAAENKKNIVLRYERGTQNPQYLNDADYAKKITGRTVGILELFDEKSNFGVIDIDSPIEESSISSDKNFENVKKITAEIYDFISKFHKTQIVFTGKNGFHIRCQMHTKMRMEQIKKVLREQLEDSEFKSLLSGRNNSSPNVDLSPNMRNGAIIVPLSLNKIGIPAVELQRKELINFRREDLIEEVLTK